jgi:hypothetical protein
MLNERGAEIDYFHHLKSMRMREGRVWLNVRNGKGIGTSCALKN